MAPDERSGEFDPEEDLLARFETMVQTQVETLDGIDDKAAYTARLVGILAGLVVSGISIVVGTHGSEVSVETGAVFLMLALSVVCLFVSLVYAFITYLSSRFEYGPRATLGTFMADYQVDEQTYKEMMLRGYSEAIRANRRVVVTNARRFERCLAYLLAGLLFLFGAGTLIALPWNGALELLVLGGFAGSAWRLHTYITEEEYLTLERERSNDE